jgi:hypothetical protein
MSIPKTIVRMGISRSIGSTSNWRKREHNRSDHQEGTDDYRELVYTANQKREHAYGSESDRPNPIYSRENVKDIEQPSDPQHDNQNGHNESFYFHDSRFLFAEH